LEPTAFLDFAFLLVATVLTLFSVHTLRLLAKLRLSKSFFIPVLVSAVFFWYGSFVNVVFNLYLQNMPNLVSIQEPINFLHQTTLLIGLSILTVGVFSYWRLTRQVKLPKTESLKQGKEPPEEAQEAQQLEQSRQKVEVTEPETSEQDKDDQTSQLPPETGLAVPEVVTASAIEEDSLQTTLAESPPKPRARRNRKTKDPNSARATGDT
jgi:hypothetical protein